jgi:TetR/AcrR family transcriptional regulator, mexJK operon transcriptional repressor
MSSNANPATEVPSESRASRKRRAILQAATTVFFREGYVGTSMDEIAALAGVSKQTVYKHFADKETLFSELVIATLNAAGDPVSENVLNLQDSGDIEGDLRDLARRQLALVMQPHVMQLRRMIIGEVGRFPDLGRTFYERGPGRTIVALATAFEQLGERGALEVDDPTRAAEHFNWLIMSIPLNRAMLLGDDESRTAKDLERYADSGVRVFLAAYGRREPVVPPRARARTTRNKPRKRSSHGPDHG